MNQSCAERWRYINGEFGPRCSLDAGHEGRHRADFGYDEHHDIRSWGG